MSNLSQFPPRNQQTFGGGPGNGDLESRLRVVEGDVREIKVRTEKVATTDDLDKLWGKIRLWIVTGSFIASVVVIGWLVDWIIRLSTQRPPS